MRQDEDTGRVIEKRVMERGEGKRCYFSKYKRIPRSILSPSFNPMSAAAAVMHSVTPTKLACVFLHKLCIPFRKYNILYAMDIVYGYSHK